MAVIVQSERWCEVPLPGGAEGNCTICDEAAITLCESCGKAVCDLHEIACSQCGRSYCATCEHACVVGQPLRKAA